MKKDDCFPLQIRMYEEIRPIVYSKQHTIIKRDTSSIVFETVYEKVFKQLFIKEERELREAERLDLRD